MESEAVYYCIDSEKTIYKITNGLIFWLYRGEYHEPYWVKSRFIDEKKLYKCSHSIISKEEVFIELL